MTRSLLISLCLLAATGCAHRQGIHEIQRGELDSTSLRKLAQGAVVGFEDKHDTQAWLGLPYAEPPVGELRWRAPQPAKPWQGTREAVRFGQPCVQFAGALTGDLFAKDDDLAGSEDCLTLNVWAPKVAAEAVPKAAARLPVMVWIHGGGNAIGTGATYQAISNLAGAHKVVAVTLNYRLGVLGWFHHPSLYGEQSTPEDRSGNYGTLDIIESLRWVQKNIEAFGGDPGNVTVFGESAGGFNVYTLLVSPLAKGLFHRAISQSGMTTTYSLSQAENFTDESEPGEFGSSKELAAAMLQRAGQAQDRAGAQAKLAAMSPAQTAAFLRERTVQDLLLPLKTKMMGMYPSPRLLRDGAVLPLDPIMEVLADPARGNRVPVILGTNRDEFKLFAAFNPKLVRLWFGVLPRVRNQVRYDRFAGYLSEMWKAVGADAPAAAMAGSGWPGVYVYRFDWDAIPDDWPLNLRKLLGAAHGMEIPFAFHDVDAESDFFRTATEANAEQRQELVESMSGYWAQLARTGEPGRGPAGRLPEWKPWSTRPRGPKTMVLDSRQRGGLRMLSEEVTLAGLKKRLLVDSTVREDPEEICAIYALSFKQFGSDGGMWNPDEYAKLGDKGCTEYPADGFMELK
ncbi:MAG TPA: carboxylesterase family protein [Myxococcales bacterium]|jgi:para-nitrobenzyl esterase